ncbi:ferredoxin-NADP reductase/nitroimidazol reductase NimA-like FMN-containing flavoprotein (pyridoxamine 5'-phosphate oxidase superfamily) [Nitrobacteraceae bacterium AZCC 1564]
MSQEFPVTQRSKLQLFGIRGSHQKSDIYAAIDSSLYGTVAYTIGDQPFATPTMVWRQDDYIYWHGSAGSRMLKTVAAGPNVSVTFVHVDGFVMSRLASAHAMNYRSVMVFGNPEPVESLEERRNQLEFFLSRLFPGRWDEVRQPSLDELRSIIMVRMRIQEGSLKKRAGLPGDGRPIFGGEKLFEQACWAGTLPIATCVGTAQDANRLKASINLPNYITTFADRFGLATRIEPTSEAIAAEVVEVRHVTPRIKLFKLKPTDGMFPRVSAGAHLKIGVVLTDQTRDYRQYTIVNADKDGAWYEIAVLREESGRGGSLYMHENVPVGTMVQVLPPENDFPLSVEAKHSVLIAGGIGITPIIAMARVLESSEGTVEVHYSARGAEEAAFLKELQSLSGAHVKFYDTSLGSAHRMDLEQVLGAHEPGKHVYVCGPHQLIADVLSVAEGYGYPANAVHREAFSAPAPKSNDQPVQIKLAKTGKTVTANPGQSILDAVLSEGLEVSHSCKRGECGLCTTKVIGGKPDHRDHFLTAAQKESDSSMCICVSWSRSPSLLLDI